MNDKVLKHALEKAFPPLPPPVHLRVRETLQQDGAAKRVKFRRTFLKAVLIGLVMLGLCAAAIAAMNQLGVLQFSQSYMREEYYFTLPEAKTLVRKNLAFLSLNEVDVRVEEAAYDGRMLSIVYSITQRDAKAPFDRQAVENGDFSFDAARRDRVGGFDWLLVNGVKVNPVSAAEAAGPENGQILFYIDSELYPVNGEPQLRPTGEITVGLPILWDGKRPRVPEGFTFTMDVGDAATRYSYKLPEPMEIDGCTVRITDLHLSPMNVYIEYTVFIPASLAQGKSQEELEKIAARFAWVWDDPEDNNGLSLGIGKDHHYGFLEAVGDGGWQVPVYARFAPGSGYGETIRLHTKAGVIEIPLIPLHEN